MKTTIVFLVFFFSLIATTVKSQNSGLLGVETSYNFYTETMGFGVETGFVGPKFGMAIHGNLFPMRGQYVSTGNISLLVNFSSKFIMQISPGFESRPEVGVLPSIGWGGKIPLSNTVYFGLASHLTLDQNLDPTLNLFRFSTSLGMKF